MIAIELVFIYINSVFSEISNGTENLKKGGDDLNKFIAGLDKSFAIIQKQRDTNLQKIALTNSVLDKIHKIEEVISKSNVGNLL